MIIPPTIQEWCYAHIRQAQANISTLDSLPAEFRDESWAAERSYQQDIIARMLKKLAKIESIPVRPRRKWWQIFK